MAKRPFWMHQAVEYLLGGVLLAIGLQSPTPAVPATLGLLLAGHAAITRGPLSAFRWIGPRLHRTVDGVLLALLVVGALQPWVDVDPGTRVIILGIAAVFGVVWRQSSFSERTKAPPPGDRAGDLGRRAGRAMGDTINAAKRMTSSRDLPPPVPPRDQTPGE
jgi:hypothetical protein